MSKKNRLNLDFSLNTMEERTNFLNKYLEIQMFKDNPPTEEELETMGTYLLWGKDENGQNAKQTKEVQLKTKWTPKETNVESLDELMASITFNEASIRKPEPNNRLKVVNDVFDREKERKRCPESVLPTLEALFAQMDILDCAIGYYEYEHGLRATIPREKLLKRMTPEQIQKGRYMQKSWNQRNYLKARHELKELRASQFSLRDSYYEPVRVILTPNTYELEEPIFGEEFSVFPLGLSTNPLIFRLRSTLAPQFYNEEELKLISDFYWQKIKETRKKQYYFDFEDKEHLHRLFQRYKELEEEVDPDNPNDSVRQLLETLQFYIKFSRMDDILKEVARLKCEKKSNPEIRDALAEKFGTSYGENYVSTLYKERVIPKIIAAVKEHAETVSNLFFPEDFKTCPDCGCTFLRTKDNFTRRMSSKDGYNNKCKACEKARRSEIKKEKEKKSDGNN